jgi:tetratricopeptide (TPR) repeat protein
MLREVAGRLNRASVLVTFNGRTFDAPLVKSRLLMSRQSGDCFPEFHADVLFPARRLWKLRLGSCKLSHLEEALLGIERQDDLEGAMVPRTYFQYLKDRDFAPIERILKHNQQDIVSLAQLFFFLCMQYAKPEAIASGEDLLSLARAYQRSGQTTQAVKCYRLSVKSGARPEAFQALALHEKRQGHTGNAIRLYEAMARRGEEPARAYEALAKLCEHQTGDLQQALHYTRQALLFLAEPTLSSGNAVQSERIALQYRYARLLRKQEMVKNSNSQEGLL